MHLLRRSLILVTALLLFTLPATSLHSVNAQGDSTYPTYVIQPGDTLGYVANLFGITVDEILSVNSFSDANLISPGQVIFIPGFPGLRGEIQMLETGLGVTFSDLIIAYQLDRAVFINLNKILSPTQLYVGSSSIVGLPAGYEPLLPVRELDAQESIFEASLLTGANPFSVQLLNASNIIGSSRGSPVFFYARESTPQFSLFAPSLSKVEISPLPVIQGATETVRVMSQKPVTLSGELDGHVLQFFSESEGNYYALQGIHALAQPGLSEFKLDVSFPDGSRHSYSSTIIISPGLFDSDPPLIVDPKTLDPQITQSENNMIEGLISTIVPTRYWTGVFQSPAVYQEFNSLYGTRRTYNDDPKITFHAGVDFAGGMYLPITAPADGVVVFAGELTVRGNTVFIDHGQGIFSGFFHQNKLMVKTGDVVTKGQQLGEVGNTGRVSGAGDYPGAGAHLHWEVWVNGVQVDPLDWLEYEYPQ